MNNKVAIFRCDGGPNIGNGHILRCLILAKYLKKKKIKVFFLIKKSSLFLKNLIKSNFKIIEIKKDSFAEISKKLSKMNCYYFILDHYNFSYILEKKISKFVNKVIVIEDFPKKKHIANLIIDQNFNRSKKDYSNLNNKECKLLVGPKYTLVDPKLKDLLVKKNKNKISNILICFGGYDGRKLSLKILKYLKKLERKFSISILLNRNDHYYRQILYFFKKNKFLGKVFNNSKLSAIIKKTDFAIIAGGTIAKEIISLQVPCMIFSTSKDQFNNCLEYDKFPIVKYMGKWNKIKEKYFIYHFSRILKLEKSLLNKKNKIIFDFDGTARIAKEILKI